MPRKHKRQTLAPGVYRDGDRIELRATAGGRTLTETLPGTTELADAIRQRAKLLARAKDDDDTPAKFTLGADIPRYLKLHAHQVSHADKLAMLGHWDVLYGHLPRHRITAEHVMSARVLWLQGQPDAKPKPIPPMSPKTVNHRVDVLRHLYAVLDGPAAKTPCDGISRLPIPKTPIQRVSDQTILAVDAQLRAREVHGARTGRRFDGAKTRARFRVLVSTGRRPSEVMRAKPSDVDLDQRVWVVRDGKGGWSPGLYLNDDMLAAWKLFADEKAWGYFNVSSYAETIRKAGWPKDVRPYNARHTTWITAAERGADMADIQIGAGHKDLKTTRNAYTGVRQSRMQRLSETLDGRFQGWPEPQAEPQRPRKTPQNRPKTGMSQARGSRQRRGETSKKR